MGSTIVEVIYEFQARNPNTIKVYKEAVIGDTVAKFIRWYIIEKCKVTYH